VPTFESKFLMMKRVGHSILKGAVTATMLPLHILARYAALTVRPVTTNHYIFWSTSTPSLLYCKCLPAMRTRAHTLAQLYLLPNDAAILCLSQRSHVEVESWDAQVRTVLNPFLTSKPFGPSYIQLYLAYLFMIRSQERATTTQFGCRAIKFHWCQWAGCVGGKTRPWHSTWWWYWSWPPSPSSDHCAISWFSCPQRSRDEDRLVAHRTVVAEDVQSSPPRLARPGQSATHALVDAILVGTGTTWPIWLVVPTSKHRPVVDRHWSRRSWHFVWPATAHKFVFASKAPCVAFSLATTRAVVGPTWETKLGARRGDFLATWRPHSWGSSAALAESPRL
jgi:hypothetical protein